MSKEIPLLMFAFPKGLGGEVCPCPKCGNWILFRGRPTTSRTPKVIRWFRHAFRHGVTCIVCGNYAPSRKIWNRRAGNDA